MKLLSLITFSALLSLASCSHFSKCKGKESCAKESCSKPCCDKETKKCKDGSCDKPKTTSDCQDGSCNKKKS